MATVRAYDVSSMFLRAINAPDTTAMRRAVALWLAYESGGTIVGNNPWNLHNGPPCRSSSRYCPGAGVLPGQIGNRYAGPGDQNVAVFRTLNDGVTANARNLIRLAPSYGYGKVLSEARRGSALGFLKALQDSNWSAGHYGYSKLVNAFRGSNTYNTLLTVRVVGGGSSTVPKAPDPAPPGVAELIGALEDFAKRLAEIGISTDPNHVITAEEAVRIATELYKHPPGNPLHEDIVRFFTGKTVAEASEGGSTSPDPLGEVGDALGQAGNILGAILDPENWLYAFALAAGGIMTAYGFSQLLNAGPTAPVAVPVAPEGT